MPREYLTGPRQEQRSYSPAVKVTGGTTVYLAGVGGATGQNSADFASQAREAFKRIAETLAQMGGKLEDIVTMTVFLTDVRYGDQFTEIRKEFFPAGRYPGSALIAVAGLARPEMLVEVQAIAVVGD